MVESDNLKKFAKLPQNVRGVLSPLLLIIDSDLRNEELIIIETWIACI